MLDPDALYELDAVQPLRRLRGQRGPGRSAHPRTRARRPGRRTSRCLVDTEFTMAIDADTTFAPDAIERMSRR